MSSTCLWKGSARNASESPSTSRNPPHTHNYPCRHLLQYTAPKRRHRQPSRVHSLRVRRAMWRCWHRAPPSTENVYLLSQVPRGHRVFTIENGSQPQWQPLRSAVHGRERHQSPHQCDVNSSNSHTAPPAPIVAECRRHRTSDCLAKRRVFTEFSHTHQFTSSLRSRQSSTTCIGSTSPRTPVAAK